MITNENNTMPYMKSLSSCLNKMVQDGYSADYKATEEGLYNLSTHKTYYPADSTDAGKAAPLTVMTTEYCE